MPGERWCHSRRLQRLGGTPPVPPFHATSPYHPWAVEEGLLVLGLHKVPLHRGQWYQKKLLLQLWIFKVFIFYLSGHGLLLRLNNQFPLCPIQPHVRDWLPSLPPQAVWADPKLAPAKVIGKGQKSAACGWLTTTVTCSQQCTRYQNMRLAHCNESEAAVILRLCFIVGETWCWLRCVTLKLLTNSENTGVQLINIFFLWVGRMDSFGTCYQQQQSQQLTHDWQQAWTQQSIQATVLDYGNKEGQFPVSAHLPTNLNPFSVFPASIYITFGWS